MIIIKVFLVLLVVYFLLEVGLFEYKYHNLPKLPTIDQSDKVLGSGPDLRFIAAGDSVTVGIGASDTQHTYAYKLATELSKTHTVYYKNIAVSGYKTQDVVDKQLSEIIKYKPDVVVISISGNDNTHLVPGKVVMQNLNIIKKELEEKTSAKIYISNVPNFYTGDLLPWFYIKLMEFRSGKLNPEIMTLEDDRLKIVNIHDYGIYKFPKKQISYSADHFHPNDLGYENWAKAFLEKIEN